MGDKSGCARFYINRDLQGKYLQNLFSTRQYLPAQGLVRVNKKRKRKIHSILLKDKKKLAGHEGTQQSRTASMSQSMNDSESFSLSDLCTVILLMLQYLSLIVFEYFKNSEPTKYQFETTGLTEEKKTDKISLSVCFVFEQICVIFLTTT